MVLSTSVWEWKADRTKRNAPESIPGVTGAWAHQGQNPHLALLPPHPATKAGCLSFLGLSAHANTQGDSDVSPERVLLLRDAVWHALSTPTCSRWTSKDNVSNASVQTNQDFMNCTAVRRGRLVCQKRAELCL